MQAYFKDNNTLIINTMIDKNEKDRLVDFVSAADNVTFKKLYDIEGEVSGIMFIKSDIPSIEVMKGISTVISFDLSDDNDVLIDVNDIETLTLECSLNDEIIFTKNKEDFKFEDSRYYINLTSNDLDVNPGEYLLRIKCKTSNYIDATTVKLIVNEGDSND